MRESLHGQVSDTFRIARESCDFRDGTDRAWRPEIQVQAVGGALGRRDGLATAAQLHGTIEFSALASVVNVFRKSACANPPARPGMVAGREPSSLLRRR